MGPRPSSPEDVPTRRAHSDRRSVPGPRLQLARMLELERGRARQSAHQNQTASGLRRDLPVHKVAAAGDSDLPVAQAVVPGQLGAAGVRQVPVPILLPAVDQVG